MLGHAVFVRSGSAAPTRRNALRAAIAVAALSAATMPAAASFNYNDFSSITGLTLVGVAAQTGNAITITPATNAQVGGVWYSAAKQDVSLGFDATMKFRIPVINGLGADGFAFVIQNTSPTALGGSGGGIGYGRNLIFNQPGITNSLAVEIDMWDNTGQWPDLSSSHISVQSLGAAENSPADSAALGAVNIPDLAAGVEHTLRIAYTPGALDIYLDGALSPSLSVAVNIGSLLPLDTNGGTTAGQAWIGVTAATGAQQNSQSQVLTALQYTGTPIPAPSAAALLAIGALSSRRRTRTA